jgi:hypothetical protein
MGKVFKQSYTLKNKEYYELNLAILNVFLPVDLTKKEIEFLSHFMSIDNPLAEMDRFNSAFKKIVRREMKISDGGMTNYMTSLKKKNIIKESDSGILYIIPSIFPDKEEVNFNIKIVKE